MSAQHAPRRAPGAAGSGSGTTIDDESDDGEEGEEEEADGGEEEDEEEVEEGVPSAAGLFTPATRSSSGSCMCGASHMRQDTTLCMWPGPTVCGDLKYMMRRWRAPFSVALTVPNMKEDTSSCRSSVPSQFSLARRTLVAAAPGAGVGCTTWRRQESRRATDTAGEGITEHGTQDSILK